MKITKNGEVIEFDNDNTTEAFLEAGWVKVEEEKTTEPVKKTRKTSIKK